MSGAKWSECSKNISRVNYRHIETNYRTIVNYSCLAHVNYRNIVVTRGTIIWYEVVYKNIPNKTETDS
jgi:hypothetical protein